MTDFKAMKKVELHLHIEGAAPPEFIRQLAREKNVDLRHVFDDDGSYKWADFAQFLKTYEAACTVLQSPDDFRRLLEAVLAAQASHNVIYTEHFLATDFCGGDDLGKWREYLAAMEEGADNALQEHGIEVRFINTCVRHFGPGKAKVAANHTVATAGGRVSGFGMGGEERHLMPADFAPAFALCDEAGLGLTCHAGEIEGHEMVDATLDAINVTRIGHGVRAIENADTVARLIDQGITLEVNPGSNIALNVFDDWPAHSITKLHNAGVKVTISTDDPPYFHTDMTHEYTMLNNHLGWSPDMLRQQNMLAMDAAFCDTDTRDRIKAQL